MVTAAVAAAATAWQRRSFVLVPSSIVLRLLGLLSDAAGDADQRMWLYWPRDRDTVYTAAQQQQQQQQECRESYSSRLKGGDGAILIP